MTALFDRVLLPLADPEDARTTCESLREYDIESVVALHVIEKAGGAPDKAGVEQREEYAGKIFDVVESVLADSVDLTTEIAYGTEIDETIFEAADDYDVSAIVITPRGGSRWIRLLTGDVALSLVTENDRPVIVLPDRDADDSETVDGIEDEGVETSDDDESTGDGDE